METKTLQTYTKVITRRPNGSKRVQTVNEHPTMTDGQYKDDTDVNQIMDRFQKTGVIRHLNKKQGHYADVTNIPDLLSASIIVKEAQEKFDSLPAVIRAEFQNDPIKLEQFIADPKNKERAIELNLIDPPSKNPMETAFENALENNDKKRNTQKPKE